MESKAQNGNLEACRFSNGVVKFWSGYVCREKRSLFAVSLAWFSWRFVGSPTPSRHVRRTLSSLWWTTWVLRRFGVALAGKRLQSRIWIAFSQCYSGSTVCAPTRATLMTGKYLGKEALRGNTGGIPLPAEETTLPELLKQAGYATGGFGK